MIYTFKVDAKGLNLASFIKEALGDKFSAKSIKKAIEKGACRVNKRVLNYANHKLNQGDVVEISIVAATKLDIEIVLDDENFCIINKPSGLVTEEKSLKPFFSYPIFLVHRLDKETTGLLILAKNGKIKKEFEALFKNRSLTKKYLAVCDGLIKTDHGIIDVPLEETKSLHHSVFVKVNPHAKDMSQTLWKRLCMGKNTTFMEFEIVTGKTHQIRVHASYMGHAILGDPVYLKKPVSPFIPTSLCLHAYYISFIHPLTHSKIEAYAKLPSDFKEALKSLIPHAKLPRY